MAENNRKKQDGRGGARPGAGRPPGKTETLSVRQVKEMRQTAERLAKKHGRTIFEVLGDWVYDTELNTKDRMPAAKLYLDKMMISVSEGGEADKNAGPAVFLPEMRPNLELVDGGKKAG